MHAERLTFAPENGARRIVGSLTLDEQNGVMGDRRSAKDGSVSLLSCEAEESIRGLGGLCTGRFQANIVTRDLDCAALEPGVRLTVGSCELEIVRVGKPCYEICTFAQGGEHCPLPKSCAFARVVRGGRIYPNDEIVFVKTEQADTQ